MQAFSDWQKDPVITSLDSIAAPIENIQFPTVTVCNDKWNEVHDNWNFLESLLDFLDFQYSYPSTGYDLSTSEALRNDFKFLIESVVNVYKDWLDKDDNLHKAENILNTDSSNPSFAKVHSKVLELLKSGNLTVDQVNGFPTRFFGGFLAYKEVRVLSCNLPCINNLHFHIPLF